MAIAGRVAIVPKGEYSNAVTYDKLDLVMFNNDAYVAKKASTGIEPTNDEYWMLILNNVVAEDLESIINGTTPVAKATDADTVDGLHAYALMKNTGSNPTDFTITQSARITNNADGKFPFNYGSYMAFSSGPQSTSGKYVLHLYATNGKLYWQKTESGDIVADKWTQAVVTSDLASYVPITQAYPVYSGDILDISDNGTYCCNKSNCTNFPPQITSWAYITKLGFRDAGYEKFIAHRVNSITSANLDEIYVASEALKDSSGNLIWKSITEDYLPLDGSVNMNGSLGFTVNGGGFRISPTNIQTQLVANGSATQGFRVLSIVTHDYTANDADALRFEGYDGNTNATYTVLHTGNSQKVVTSASAPSDTSALWIDTTNKKVKAYIDGAWTAMA